MTSVKMNLLVSDNYTLLICCPLSFGFGIDSFTYEKKVAPPFIEYLVIIYRREIELSNVLV